MTGDEALALLRAYLHDRPGDLDTGAEWDPASCEWTPDDLIGFWNAAWMEYCRRTPILDATGVPCTATVPRETDGRVALHASVLWVERCTLSDVPLQRTDPQQLDRAYRHAVEPWETCTGSPTAYLIEPGTPPTLRLFPAPLLDTTVHLTVRRGPVDPLNFGNLGATLDGIDETAAQTIMHWAAALAWSRPRTATFSLELAATERALFERAVGPELRPDDLAFRQATAGQPPLRARVYRY